MIDKILVPKVCRGIQDLPLSRSAVLEVQDELLGSQNTWVTTDYV